MSVHDAFYFAGFILLLFGAWLGLILLLEVGNDDNSDDSDI